MMTEVFVSLRVWVRSWHPLLSVAARTVVSSSCKSVMRRSSAMKVNNLRMGCESSQSVLRVRREYGLRKGKLCTASCQLRHDAEHPARLAKAENIVSLISKCEIIKTVFENATVSTRRFFIPVLLINSFGLLRRRVGGGKRQ